MYQRKQFNRQVKFVLIYKITSMYIFLLLKFYLTNVIKTKTPSMFQLLNRKFCIDLKQRNLRLGAIHKGRTQNFWNFRLCSSLNLFQYICFWAISLSFFNVDFLYVWILILLFCTFSRFPFIISLIFKISNWNNKPIETQKN